MHSHNVAHLDISLQNLVTDSKGHYACIDYENSRHFSPTIQSHLLYNYRGTEMPPECEGQTRVNPFKVDIWSLGVLMLRTSKVRQTKKYVTTKLLTFWDQLTGHWIPELMDIISPMLNEKPVCRPPANNILQTFKKIVASLEDRLGPECLNFC